MKFQNCWRTVAGLKYAAVLLPMTLLAIACGGPPETITEAQIRLEANESAEDAARLVNRDMAVFVDAVGPECVTALNSAVWLDQTADSDYDFNKYGGAAIIAISCGELDETEDLDYLYENYKDRIGQEIFENVSREILEDLTVDDSEMEALQDFAYLRLRGEYQEDSDYTVEAANG